MGPNNARAGFRRRGACKTPRGKKKGRKQRKAAAQGDEGWRTASSSPSKHILKKKKNLASFRLNNGKQNNTFTLTYAHSDTAEY